MKAVLLTGFFFLSFNAVAQYYYKDILGTRESAGLINSYRTNKVRNVRLNSYTINNTPISNFSIQQEYLPAQQALRTVTKTDFTNPSYLTTYVDAAGRVAKTTDSADAVVNITTYGYDNAGNLVSIFTKMGDTLAATASDEHLWKYDAKNKVSRMLRIRNKKDTSVVSFKLDEQGNPIEEQEKRRAITEEPYYYYYNNANQLTDIVRYNYQAGRLLPELMFEYSETGQLLQRMTIPQKSDNYLRWRYGYNDKGLKTKEIIFNKEKEQTGKVEYEYTFGN